VQIRGRFFAPESTGLRRPIELRVFERGVVATLLEQHERLTRFGFESGCRLRLQIRTAENPSQRES